MHAEPAAVAFVAWIPLVGLLFWALGPARASAIGVLAGFLYLPRVVLFLGPIPIDKRVVAGLAVLAGMIVFDFRAFLKPRPRWFDLPMVVLILSPLTGLVVGVAGSGPDLFNMILQRVAGYFVPYVAARLYFQDGDGPRRIAIAIAIAGLSYIPVCLYEEIAGPGRYLSTLIYGTHPYAEMVNRLGGYRPEGFLENGLQLASWMALAATTSVWLWLGRGYRSRWMPPWIVAPALVLASISCRGVYGYITLGCGIVAALLTRGLRTRLVLLALAVIPVAYMVARASGLWGGRLLDRAAILAGRPGTVGFRLDAEDELIGRVLRQGPVFGFGNYVWHAAEPIRWPDGQWLQLLWSGGLVGLLVAIVGLYAFPAARALSSPGGRPSPGEAASPLWALSCWCVLALVDMLHNDNTLAVSGLVAGSIVGNVIDANPPRSASRPAAGGRKPFRIGAVAPPDRDRGRPARDRDRRAAPTPA